MDRNQPIDPNKASLPHAFRGYDPKVVDERLAYYSQEVENLHTELRQARIDIERLTNELQGYRGMETALKDALLVAQKAADETRLNAHAEAEVMLASARQQAVEEQHVLASEVRSLTIQIDSLNREKDRFERQFRGLLQDHLRELDQLYATPTAVVMSGAPTVEIQKPAEAKVEEIDNAVVAEA